MRDVGQLQQEVAQLGLNAIEIGFEALDLVTEARNLRKQRRRIRALRLCDTDVPGRRVAQSLQLLRAHLNVLARGLQRFEAPDVERVATPGQRGGDRRDVVAQ